MTRPIQQKKPVPGDWHPADIKAALEKRGWSLRRLSVANGFHPSSLRAAISRPYANAEHIIAAAIGVTPQAIWPSRYQVPRPRFGVGGRRFHRGYKPTLKDTCIDGNVIGNRGGGA